MGFFRNRRNSTSKVAGAEQQATSANTPGTTVYRTTSVSVNGQPASAEQIAQFETMTGMDLDGDGVVGAAGSAGAASPSGTPNAVQVVSGDEAQRLLGTFLGATDQPLGTATGTVTGTAPGAPPDDASRVGALERLAALHASGALTDAEFNAEKRRILRSE